MTGDSHVTTGKVYKSVIEKERKGDFLGKTVQVVPHVTNAIQEHITKVATTPVKGSDGSTAMPDICVVELGGTIGDMESLPFIEALRQLRHKVGKVNFNSVFVSLIPEIVGHEGELVQKTKPTQHGVKELRYRGLAPDIIVCRSDSVMLEEARNSLAMFCQVAKEQVINLWDASNIYRIPLTLQEQGVCNLLNKQLQLEWRLPSLLQRWHDYADRAECLKPAEATPDAEHRPTGRSPVRSPRPAYGLPRGAINTVRVVLVTASLPKYKVYDSQLSVVKALKHAGIAMGINFKIDTLPAEDIANGDDADFEDLNLTPTKLGNRSRSPSPPPGGLKATRKKRELASAWRLLRTADALVMCGVGMESYNSSGNEAPLAASIEGRLNAVRHSRENKVPFIGVGIGA
jgi:CTP synthase